jgi:drug/metabolite transporter (DMT)-like permease
MTAMEKQAVRGGLPEPDARSRRLGIVAVSVATFVWAWGTILVKWSSLPGLQFAMFRLWAGVVVSSVALLVTRRRLTWTTFRACAPGGVFFAADIGVGFVAVKHTTIADVALIGSLGAVVIAVISARMLGERISTRDRVLIGVSVLGVAVVALASSGSPSFSLLGDFLAFCGLGTWSAYWFFSRRARQDVPSIEYFASVMIAGALVMTPVALLVSGVPSMPAASDWFAVVGVALLPGFVGHTLVIWSHRHVESWLSAVITQSSPVFSALLAWPVLGEAITPMVAVGGLVVVGATAAVIVGTAKRAPLEVEEPGELAL